MLKKLLSLCCGFLIYTSAPSLSMATENLPIADVHMHAYEKSESEANWFLKKMNELNVKWGGGVGSYSDHMVDVLGNRFIPAFGQSKFFTAFKTGGEEALKDPNNRYIKSLLRKADQLFQQGKIKGFGEIHTDNRTSGPKRIRRQIPVNSSVVLEMYKIANKYNGFVHLHVQYSPSLASDVIKLSKDFPNSITILAHCVPGRTRDVIPLLRTVFKQTNNVYCETSGVNGPTHASNAPLFTKLFGKGNGRMYGVSGLNKWWKKLIETFPDRVMVGTDPCCGLKQKYPELVKEIREYLLPSLSPAIAKRVAYENAVSVFGLK